MGSCASGLQHAGTRCAGAFRLAESSHPGATDLCILTWVEPPCEEIEDPGPNMRSAVKEMLTPRSYLVPMGHVKFVKLTSTPPEHRSCPLPLTYLAAHAQPE